MRHATGSEDSRRGGAGIRSVTLIAREVGTCTQGTLKNLAVDVY